MKTSVEIELVNLANQFRQECKPPEIFNKPASNIGLEFSLGIMLKTFSSIVGGPKVTRRARVGYTLLKGLFSISRQRWREFSFNNQCMYGDTHK